MRTRARGACTSLAAAALLQAAAARAQEKPPELPDVASLSCVPRSSTTALSVAATIASILTVGTLEDYRGAALIWNLSTPERRLLSLSYDLHPAPVCEDGQEPGSRPADDPETSPRMFASFLLERVPATGRRVPVTPESYARWRKKNNGFLEPVMDATTDDKRKKIQKATADLEKLLAQLKEEQDYRRPASVENLPTGKAFSWDTPLPWDWSAVVRYLNGPGDGSDQRMRKIILEIAKKLDGLPHFSRD